MRVGFLGAGKLATPVALAIESKGHDVLVCDTSPHVQEAIASRTWPHKEQDVPDLLASSRIRCVSLPELVQHAEVLFICVQTPHEPKYSGATLLPDDRKDFDYTALKDAVRQAVSAIQDSPLGVTPPVLAVISTVLPGTLRREILPFLPKHIPFVYCPFFAAMGTVVRDVLDPEFVILGMDSPSRAHAGARSALRELFSSLHSAPVIEMSIESAEATKVCYNLTISAKITIANTIMEIAHKTPGCDVDEVTSALKRATQRIISPAYMDGGVGDGGNCFHGETPINTVDGKLPIAYLAAKIQKTLVWTMNKEGACITSPAVNIRKTRNQQRLVRVVMHGDPQKYIDCTPDHRFLRINPKEPIQAWDIQPDMALRVMVNGQPATMGVARVERLPGLHDVYCMEVPDVGWFFANDTYVQNCHPRDAIAMSHLADKLHLSCNIFDEVMYAREDQTKWLVDLLLQHRGELPICVLGRSYKPESNLTDGSCGLLVADILTKANLSFTHHDPHVDVHDLKWLDYNVGSGPLPPPMAFLICTKHACFASWRFPPGSVVVDVFRYIPAQPGVKIIGVGRGEMHAWSTHIEMEK